MSDEQNQTTEETGPKALREALERTQAELEAERERVAAMRNDLMVNAYESLGLDVTKGLGKAIAKEYKGDPTVDAIAAFATEEYGWERPAAAPNAPMQTQIQQEAQNRVDQATASGRPSMPADNSIQSEITRAEAEGDFATASRLKAQMFAALQAQQQPGYTSG